MFQRLGPLEIGLILVVLLIIFGVGRLPQVGESIGKAIHGFKKSINGAEEIKNIARIVSNGKPGPKI